MSDVFASISVSLDGFVAGPGDGPGNPLGDGGERLHEWVYPLAAWRERHGLPGGTAGPDSDVMAADWARTGAYVMGRRMYECGEEPWGAEPPFRAPVFVVTGTPRDPVGRAGGTTFTFVTGGIGEAVDRAKQAAGHRDVAAAGGGALIRGLLAGGQLDELRLHLVPVTLGAGVPLLTDPGGRGIRPVAFNTTAVLASPGVTHLTLRPAGPTDGRPVE